MDHVGFSIINQLDKGKGRVGRTTKPKAKSIYQTEKVINLAKQAAIEETISAADEEKNRLANEINKLWLSPNNDAIWHTIGGSE